MAALTRWTNGRFQRAFEFVQQQRRRYMLISQMAELLKDLDMYVPGGAGQGQWDIGLHAQTGHPCAVVPYKFEPQVSRPFGGGRPDTTAAPITYNPQPICAVLAGNLYNDDLILSVANNIKRRRTGTSSIRSCERLGSESGVRVVTLTPDSDLELTRR